MIIIHLSGGLGNQMFQYAVGRAFSMRNKDVVKLDCSWFESHHMTDTDRPYKLDIFSLEAERATDQEIKALKPSIVLRKIGWGKYYHKEKTFEFDPNVMLLQGDIYLDGYWQSEKYFKDFENVIRKDFSLKHPLSRIAQRIEEEIRNTSGAVSLHIRRGDYVSSAKTNAFHGTCSLEYYGKAINYIKNRVGNGMLFVFSDDIEWAKEQELFEGATFVSSPEIKDYEEMVLMSKCNHHITANSSFSWWGAWLNPSQEKIVVAPKQWFWQGNNNTKDLIPENWNTL